MRRLRYQVAASLDGYIAGPNGEFDWIPMDPEIDFAALWAAYDTVVMGRKTYEGLAGYWPNQTGRWADMVNAMPKYVASTTLSGDLEWNATLLEGDLEHSIPKLTQEVDGDLFMHGSGEFAYALAERGLIDAYEVYLNPLVWGKANAHVLGDRGSVWLRLDEVRRFDSGVVLLTYLPKA